MYALQPLIKQGVVTLNIVHLLLTIIILIHPHNSTPHPLLVSLTLTLINEEAQLVARVLHLVLISLTLTGLKLMLKDSALRNAHQRIFSRPP